MKSTCNSDPASVGERSDDKSSGSSKILIPIEKLGLNLSGQNSLIDVIKSQLLQPLEIVHGLACLQILHNISIVHILGDQSHKCFSFQRGQVWSDELYQLIELINIGGVPLCHVIVVRVVKVPFCNGGPHYAVNY